jgi:hypothetical protein
LIPKNFDEVPSRPGKTAGQPAAPRVDASALRPTSPETLRRVERENAGELANAKSAPPRPA